MGKKGTWFSSIKTLFTSTPNHNNQEQEGKQKKGRFKLKHGSFFRGREPSSIEKILGEVDQQTIPYHHHPQPQPNSPPPPRHIQIQIPQTTHVSKSPPPRHIQIPQTTHVSNPRQIEIPQTQASYSYSPTPTTHIPPLQHLSATKIQAAYRGYMARKKRNRSRSRSLTNGVVRLQSVVTGQHVKRQTVNAMKQMQLLVRLQTQIHSRRIQMNQQPLNKQQQQQLLSESEIEMGDEYSWDDTLITKEERQARLHRKAEALIKRQKAMAYAHSHQLWKAKPKSAQNSIQSGWWWSRLERHFPSHGKNHQFASTPSPSTSTSRPTTPRLIKKTSLSPMSTRSMVPPRTRQRMKYSNSIKDDDSLMSCPPFSSVPNYMSPTVSAKAKARPTSNPKDRMPSSSSPGSVSLPLTPNSIGSVNWKKGSGSSTRKHKSPGSIGELSMDSTFSALGRKPFNRFV